MKEKVVNDLNILLELIETFCQKYPKNIKLETLKYLIEELKNKDLKLSDFIKKLKIIEICLGDILNGLQDINYEDYKYLKGYLIHNEYYSQDERNKKFQEQLKYNDYYIYLIDNLNLVNLLDKNKIQFNTENELKEFIERQFGLEIIIKPKTNNFELEYQQYYNYLMKNGYKYSISKEYDPLTIAIELATIFGGKVLTEGSILYTKSFNYPKDFNNKEYLKKQKRFLTLHHDKSFLEYYKELNFLINKVSLHMIKQINFLKVLKENIQNILTNEILFLDKCYMGYEPRFGYGQYINIDYYKSLDAHSLRENLHDNSLGTWKLCNNITCTKNNDYQTCDYLEYFDFQKSDYKIKGDKKLKIELESINYSDFEKIIDLIKDKYIIERNQNLDYDTLINEYYSHFGMAPKEFVEMIKLKYNCIVICPNLESKSTKLIIKRDINF